MWMNPDPPPAPRAGQEPASPPPAALPWDAFRHQAPSGIPSGWQWGGGYMKHPPASGRELGAGRWVLHLMGESWDWSLTLLWAVLSPFAMPGGMGAPHLMRMAVPGMALCMQKATQGLISAPAVLAGRQFQFHAEAAADEVSGFFRKPLPRRA